MNLISHFKECPPSKEVKPQRITAGTIVRPARTSLADFDDILTRPVEQLLNIPLYQYLQCAVQKGYAAIREGRVELLSVQDFGLRPFGSSQLEQLVHEGVLDDRTMASLETQGVFGNPAKDHPTYISRADWNGETYCGETEAVQNKLVILELDLGVLLERRTVFIDPETINEKAGFSDWRNEMGKAFFVVGGIPIEAIQVIRPKYAQDWTGPVPLVETK